MSGIEALIPLINKLQDVFNQVGIENLDLPQIAVVGEQSAGKSSVLENCVGKDFLPRGSGIVTRRPLVLQLVLNKGEEYAEFLHCKNKKFTDFNLVRKEIEEETDRITGKNKNISPIPINLRIFSPHVIDLTLIDLPGMTKVPVGDQPQDIEKQIKEMLLNFITSPNSLILAVTPATIDLANSEALKLAREVDPLGNRTIGVITKLDLMDQGTNALEVLMNRVYPLKRGYIGIVNRSQRDIDGKKDIYAAQEAEKRFFLSHEVYRSVADRMGTKYLQTQLNIQLTKHIKDSLPSLRSKLVSQISLLEKDVTAYKMLASGDTLNSTRIVMSNIQNLVSKIDLQLGFSNADINISEYSGGANINNMFIQKLPYELHKKLFDETSLSKKILFAIKNSTGVNSQIFSPHNAFSSLIKKQIEEFKDVLLSIISNVANQLFNIFSGQLKCLNMYPKLRDEIENLFTRTLKKLEDQAKDNVVIFLQIQISYINTNHPDFISFIEGRSQTTKGVITMASEVKKGWISMQTSGLLKNQRVVYLVLKKEQLLVFKDDTEQELRLTIENTNLKVRDLKQKYSFSIFNCDGKILSKDTKTLDLSGSSELDAEDWKAALLSIGIIPEFRMDDKMIGEKIDPQTQKQIDQVILYFNAYKNLTIKTMCDALPKICMYFLINNFRTFCSEDLIPEVLSFDVKRLTKESDDSVKKRESTIKLYESCQKGLELINDVMRHNDDDIYGSEIEESYNQNRKLANELGRSITTSSSTDFLNSINNNNSLTKPQNFQRPTTAISAPKKPPPVPKRD